MNWKTIVGSLAALVGAVLVAYVWFMGAETREYQPAEDFLPALSETPYGASYNIDGREVLLVDGEADEELVLGAASRAVTRLWGEPVYGDLDGDGDEDALVLLTHHEGGSGTRYYVAVAVREQQGFVGSNAVLLGDRIAPHTTDIWHDVAVVNYAEQLSEESFGDAPRMAVSRYFSVSGAQLTEYGPYEGEGVQILAGNFVYGHESRTFTPCGEEPAWISPESSADAALRAIYEARQLARGAKVYQEVFVVVAGRYAPAPEEGFGMDFEQAFQVEGVLAAPEKGFCTVLQDEVVEDSSQAVSALEH